MSEEEEKVVEEVVMVAAPVGIVEKITNAVKVGFATKKALIAAHALFYGVTAATAVGVSNGMTADEAAVQDKMVQTIDTLEAKVVDLQIIIIELNEVHGVESHEHAPVPHEHPDIVALTGVFGHEHDDPEPVLVPHEHAPVVFPEPQLIPHEHEKQICPTPPPIVLEGEHTHKFDPLRGCRSFYNE